MSETTHPDPARRTSPLEAARERMSKASVAEPQGIALGEIPFLAQINLRGDALDPAFLGAVGRAVGLELPTIPNTVTAGRAMRILWLGPDEWLLVGEAGAEGPILARLNAALAGICASAVDVSANRAVLTVSGGASRSLLMKGCSLDLHPRAFSPLRCAQTNFARTTVILEQSDEVPAWRLFVRSSFASYLTNWLIDAAREYGLAKRSP